MPKLSKLLAEKAKAEIQVGNSTVHFVYYPMWRERFTEEERESHVDMPFREYIKGFLSQVVDSWDFIDDDGETVPVTAAAIEQHSIPDSLLLAIHSRIVNSDLSGKVPTSNNSHVT